MPCVIYENVDIVFIEIYRIHYWLEGDFHKKNKPKWFRFKETVFLVNNK